MNWIELNWMNVIRSNEGVIRRERRRGNHLQHNWTFKYRIKISAKTTATRTATVATGNSKY